MIEWCEHHKNDVPKIDEDDCEEKKENKEIVIPPWDEEFLKLEPETGVKEKLFPIMLVSHLLSLFV